MMYFTTELSVTKNTDLEGNPSARKLRKVDRHAYYIYIYIYISFYTQNDIAIVVFFFVYFDFMCEYTAS